MISVFFRRITRYFTSASLCCLLPIITASSLHIPAITVRGTVARIPTRSIRHRDTLYLPIAAISRAYGLILTEQDGTSFVFSSQDCRLELTPGSREVTINGETVEMSGPADWVDGKMVVPIYLAILTLPARFPPGELPPVIPAPSLVRITLDPGHGGIDPGAVGENGLLEKDVVLEISRKVRSLLEIKGYDVFLTRSGDQFISLKKRARLANRRQSDLFVSIHANAAYNQLAQGTETFYYAPASDLWARKLAALENAVLKLESAEESNGQLNTNTGNGGGGGRKQNRLAASIRAARCVQERISTVTEFSDRGTKTAEFYVLKYTRMPSILVETGFLSNRHERDLLADSNYRVKMAQAIARGIDDYIQSQVSRKRATPLKAKEDILLSDRAP